MSLNSNFWPNGLGAATGDDLVLDSPWYTSSTTRFVSSVIGSDSNTGLERLQPKLTLQAAMTASSAGDIIVLAALHSEVVAAAVVITAGVTIVGEGKSGSDPTAKLTVNSAAASVLTADAADIEVRNIKFPTNPQSNSSERVLVGGSSPAPSFLLKGCLFECTGTDADYGFRATDAQYLRVQGCRFVATSTSGTLPSTPFRVSDSNIASMRISDTIFDGGTVGYDGGYGIETNVPGSFAVFDNISLLGGADMKVAEGLSGRINPQTTTGASRVTFEEPP